MVRLLRATLPFLLLLAACNDREKGDSGVRVPEGEPWVGQEIWITYFSPQFQSFGRRTGLSRDEARRLSDELRQKVLDGADIGELAREHSNAPGGVALGFSYWLGPRRDRKTPVDVRDDAIMRTPIGELTDTVDWKGGWWFARRVSEARGKELHALFEKARQEPSRSVEVVFVAWDGVWWEDEENDKIKRTKEQALAIAEQALQRALSGVDFHLVVKELSDLKEDATKGYGPGGLVLVPLEDGTWTEWIRRQQPTLPRTLLEAIFAAEVGKVHPKVVVTEWGAFVFKVVGTRRQ
jgi:hypothetical protein